MIDFRRSTDWRLRLSGPFMGCWFALHVGPFMVFVGPKARAFR